MSHFAKLGRPNVARDRRQWEMRERWIHRRLEQEIAESIEKLVHGEKVNWRPPKDLIPAMLATPAGRKSTRTWYGRKGP